MRLAQQKLDDIELIVGELSANALRYTDGPVAVALNHFEEHFEIAVVDKGPCFELRSRRAPSVRQEGGRGLFIVESLSDSLRIERKDGNCVVTVTIASSFATGVQQKSPPPPSIGTLYTN